MESGHNKWSTIKHDKAKNDALRNKVALKYAAQIAVAARRKFIFLFFFLFTILHLSPTCVKDLTNKSIFIVGGSDPVLNFRLATAIDNAAKANVPKKTIESAIKRGTGSSSSSTNGAADMAVYEGMGPGGVAFVVEALTDNKNRTVGHVKAAFSKYGGVLSPTAYLFERRGWIEVAPKVGETENETFEVLIDLGAQDLEVLNNNEVQQDEGAVDASAGASASDGSSNGDTMFAVYTNMQDTAKVAQEIKAAGYEIKDLGIEYASNEETEVEGLDHVQKAAYERLCNTLEDIDDVVDIYTNLKV